MAAHTCDIASGRSHGEALKTSRSSCVFTNCLKSDSVQDLLLCQSNHGANRQRSPLSTQLPLYDTCIGTQMLREGRAMTGQALQAQIPRRRW